MAEMKKAGKAPKTLIAYAVAARLVREAFGERRDASALRGLYMPTPRYREAFRFMSHELNPSTPFTPMRSRIRRMVLPPA